MEPAVADVPLEIITNILSWLPVKCLLRFKCVSKSWYDVIGDPNFIKMHLAHSTKINSNRILIIQDMDLGTTTSINSAPFAADASDAALLGSKTRMIPHPLLDKQRLPNMITLSYCNGVFSVMEGINHNKFLLWNPSIRRYKEILFEPIERSDISMVILKVEVGFGYDGVNDEHKVVMTVHLCYVNGESRSDATMVKVYSLKTNTWRRVQDLPIKHFKLPRLWEPIYLNNTIHWCLWDADAMENEKLKLVTFDCVNEQFHINTVSIQMDEFADDHSIWFLKVLQGYLCICINYRLTHNKAWIMKEYGVHESWTELYTIVELRERWVSYGCNPLAFSKRGDKILLVEDSHHAAWYDLQSKTFERLDKTGLPYKFCATGCVGSLVLHDCELVVDRRPKLGGYWQ